MRILILGWLAALTALVIHGMGRPTRAVFDPFTILLVLIVLGSPRRYVLLHVLLLGFVRVQTTVEPPSSVLLTDLVLASLLLFARRTFYFRDPVSLCLVGVLAYWLEPLLADLLNPDTHAGAELVWPAMLLTGCLVPWTAWLLRKTPGFRELFVLGGR